ncbi:MAG: TetR/AcrR family transcriptional regulator [Myxococcales bacterium]|nr:TetR/AcrR family transcriptional regulator [Myxococcales bacterium]MCB9749395.1 TetR/AcrR family transcriptional regulator [Myxococcales bacterium]
MPRATFFNLPADKRQRIIEVALEEFAERPYDQASISRVVSRLGIAKGSLYQYFDGKRELFTWLVEEAGRKKLEAVSATPPPTGADLYARLRWLYAQGLLFIAASPRWARVALRSVEPSLDPEISRLRASSEAAAQAFLREQLARGQEEGSVRGDLSLELVVPLVHGLLSEGLMRAFLARAGVTDPLDPAAQSLGREDALAVVDAALSLLERGLRRGAP